MDFNQIRKKIYKNKFISRLLPFISNLMIKLHLMEKMVIVRCDGGLCSQINFYLVGRCFMDMGYKVKFDNDWFGLHGKDMNGIFSRNFDLLKIFPALSYELASPKEIFYYRKCFRYVNDSNEKVNWMGKKPPIYMDGYYRLDPVIFKKYINRYFYINYDILDTKNLEMRKQIMKNDSVAIHVRRGDLAEFVASYGPSIDGLYFLHAVQKLKQSVRGKYDNFFFYFFSDEPKWVEENLIPILQNDIKNNFFIISINGSDKGYMDLLLMTCCKYVITSQGSLGKFAALLAEDNIKKVIFPDSDKYIAWWMKILDNIVIAEAN